MISDFGQKNFWTYIGGSYNVIAKITSQPRKIFFASVIIFFILWTVHNFILNKESPGARGDFDLIFSRFWKSDRNRLPRPKIDFSIF